ncbi:MAG: hypothetical protein SPD11_14865 [Sphaerochaetaceae bacterium]|nr:hypothetical protein [Sphaerochaetaceae bacterium]
MAYTNRTFRIQRTLSAVYLCLLTVMIGINSYTLVSLYGWESYFVPRYFVFGAHIPTFLVLLLCNLLTWMYDARWARALHVATFLFQSYVGLLYSVSSFYGWAIGLVTLLLMKKYRFLKTRIILKAVILYLSFLLSCIISTFVNHEPLGSIFSPTIFLIFILSFSYIIFRDEIQEALRDKSQLKALQEKVTRLNDNLEEERAAAQRLKDELQEQLARQPNEHEKQAILEKLAKFSAKQLDSAGQQKELNALADNIREGLKKIPGLETCTESEIELLFLFYIHRGNLSNGSIAQLMGLDLYTVKNRMKSLFHKVDGIENRTGLFVYIDDNIVLKEEGSKAGTCPTKPAVR